MRVAGLAILLLVVLGSVVPAREPAKDDLLEAFENKLRAANQSAGPAVVCVVVSRSDRYPKPSDEQPGKLGGFDRAEFQKAHPTEARLARTLDLSLPENIADHGYACGVVIDPTGLVLTPYHVIDGATKIYVYLPGRPGSYADIHAADARADLAVLRLLTPPNDRPALKFADVHVAGKRQPQTSLENGKLVILMANPHVSGFAIDRPSAPWGSITNVRWPDTEGKNTEGKASESYYSYGPLIEHGAKLNADVSGAALLNLNGELVGLTTTAAGITGGERAPGLAFPADENFRRVVGVLRRGEEVEYGYLGVTLQSDTTIGSVVRHSPADRAHIRSGDTITAVNGARISTYGELLYRVGSGLAGERVKLTVRRLGGQQPDVELTLGKFDHKQPFIASARPAPVFGLRVDYSSILAQAVRDNRQVLTNGVPDGVAVRELAPNSPAAIAFKKLGDVPTRWLITQVNGTAVSTPAEFYKAAKDQKTVKLTVHDPTEPNVKEREVTFP
jgi:serine protease Do